jgi:hypothetical protein
MITDALLQLSSAQALTTGTIVSTNTIDLGSARDIFKGEPLTVHFSVDTVFAGVTSVQPQVITSASANLGTPTVIASGPVIPLASLVAGARFAVIPKNVNSNGQRYLGVQYAIVGTGTGAMSATIVLDIEDRANYASGFAII